MLRSALSKQEKSVDNHARPPSLKPSPKPSRPPARKPAPAAAERKGARRAADIAPSLLDALCSGQAASALLPELLALDQARLARSVFPDLPASALAAIDAACAQGILKRMQGIGAALWAALGADGVAACQAHRADTVRGWACFMLGAQAGQPLAARLHALRPLAADAHFGVREWAWLAVRPHLAAELELAIALLAPWSLEPDANLRRFASEALRPHGVWCAHIEALKRDPQQALPVLEPLRADASRYVQDSVANWLNDAAKTRPDWVRAVCQSWQRASDCAATDYITRRALRSLK